MRNPEQSNLECGGNKKDGEGENKGVWELHLPDGTIQRFKTRKEYEEAVREYKEGNQ